jgi:hypothetical protein
MRFGPALVDSHFHPLNILGAIEASALILAEDGQLDAQQGN